MVTVVSLGITLVAALLVTPWAIRLGSRLAIVDVVGRVRTIHRDPVPRTGGLVVVSIVLLFSLGTASWIDLPGLDRTFLRAVTGGVGLLGLLGLADDWRGLRPLHKLFGQIAVAACVFALGFRVERLVFLGPPIELDQLTSMALTIGWLVTTINAMNLIDGMDGLASGFALLSAGAATLIGSAHGDVALTLIGSAVVGSSLGVLRHNFHPARVFLGDCGSMSLGLLLGMLALRAGQNPERAVTVGVPVLLMGLPLLDTTVAVVRRFLAGRPIFEGDADHIHHRLLRLGLSQRQVAALVYLLCTAMFLLAVVYSRAGNQERVLLLGALAASVLGGLVLLEYVIVEPSTWRGLVERRRRNLALRALLRELVQGAEARDGRRLFLEASGRLGPLLGARAITFTPAGRTPLVWGTTEGAGEPAKEHRFLAIGTGGRELGTLTFVLPEASRTTDLAVAVTGLCRALSAAAPPSDTVPPAAGLQLITGGLNRSLAQR